MQAARGVVDLAVELAARVQRRHDHFEGGLALELGMRVDRDAAAVVGDGEEAVRPRRCTSIQVAWPATASSMAVVDHLGEQVVQRLLVGAADVHAGPAPDRLEAFQHLDVGGRVALGAVGWLADGTNHFRFRLLLPLGVSAGSLPSRLRAAGCAQPPAPPPAAPPASSPPPRLARAWTRRTCRTGRARHRRRLAWVSSPLLARL